MNLLQQSRETWQEMHKYVRSGRWTPLRNTATLYIRCLHAFDSNQTNTLAWGETWCLCRKSLLRWSESFFHQYTKRWAMMMLDDTRSAIAGSIVSTIYIDPKTSSVHLSMAGSSTSGVDEHLNFLQGNTSLSRIQTFQSSSTRQWFLREILCNHLVSYGLNILNDVRNYFLLMFLDGGMEIVTISPSKCNLLM